MTDAEIEKRIRGNVPGYNDIEHGDYGCPSAALLRIIEGLRGDIELMKKLMGDVCGTEPENDCPECMIKEFCSKGEGI